MSIGALISVSSFPLGAFIILIALFISNIYIEKMEATIITINNLIIITPKRVI